jgi:hypothetical protein
MAQFIRYEDCIGRSFHAKSVRPSLPSVNDDVRLDTAFHPLSKAAYQRLSHSITSAVSFKLSRRVFVQWGKVGKLVLNVLWGYDS